MQSFSLKTLKLAHLFMEKLSVLHSYILSTYLFWLPWMFTWRSSMEEDNGMVVMGATMMVFLSPLTVPLCLVFLPIVIFVQLLNTNIFFRLGMSLLFLTLIFLYYVFLFFVSTSIVRYVTRRLKKKIESIQTNLPEQM